MVRLWKKRGVPRSVNGLQRSTRVVPRLTQVNVKPREMPSLYSEVDN